MSDVRASSGVPVLAQFGGTVTPSACAPLVVDSATGFIYSLKTGDVVVQTGNVVGPAGATSGNVVLFDGATGLLVKDGGTLGTAAFTAASAYDVAGAAAAVTPTTLGLVIGTNTQAHGAKLDSIQALVSAAGWLHNDGAGTFAYSTPTAANVGALAVGAQAADSAQLLGKTWATPAAIGTTTPAAGTFTTVTLQTSGGTPAALDFYEQYTAASTACSGAITTSCVWSLIRIGTLVMLHLPAVTGSGSAAASFVVGAAIPVRFRPAAEFLMPVVEIINNGARVSTPGTLDVTTSGTINVFRDGTLSTNFTASATAGMDACNITWSV